MNRKGRRFRSSYPNVWGIGGQFIERLLDNIMTGRSAVRLARVLREHEVGGSNPLAPIFLNWINAHCGRGVAQWG